MLLIMSKETRDDLKYCIATIVMALIGIGTFYIFTGGLKHVTLLDEIFCALFATDIIYAIYQMIIKTIDRRKNKKKE